MQSIWRGMRRDRNFPLQRADTHRMQYLSCRLVVDGVVLKKQPGILFETGGCRRATSAKSNGFVKPFRGFMCKPTSCKLSTTVWPTLHMRQDKQSPLVGQTRTDCSLVIFQIPPRSTPYNRPN